MKSQDLRDESETPPPSSNLQPKEKKLKDAVMKLFMSRYSSDSPLLQAQKIKLIEENISSFFPALKTRPTHPPYATMVIEAIKEMNEGGGSNVDEISNYIQRNFQGLPFAHSHFLKHYLTKLVHSGEISLHLYSNAYCYALPDLNCKPNTGREKEHEQHHHHQQKRSRGRLRKKYATDDHEEGGDGLVDYSDLMDSPPEENFVVQMESSIQLRSYNNEEDSMELGKNGEKHQRGDYSNIVIGLASNALRQQQFTGEGRPSRIQLVNQQENVEQRHQSACAKPVLETGKRSGRGRPRKIDAHQREIVEQHHRKMTAKHDTAEQCNPNGDSSPVDEIEERTSQQRQSKGRGRPRRTRAHQQEIVEHHQNADSTQLVEVKLGLQQTPCRGRPLEMQIERGTVEQTNPTSDSSAMVEYEGGSSQQPRSKVNKMRKKQNSSKPSPPQDIPEVMQQTVTELGGTTPVWLFEKTISKSDTLPQQARIFLTSQALKGLLTPADRKKYWILKGDTSSNKKNEKKKHTVTLVEPVGKSSEINFKIWGGKKPPVVGEGQPVLTGPNWNVLVRKYKMVQGTKLQFWCFRIADTNELCFAMNIKV